MNQPSLTIMCGLPRIGKSSWIKLNKGDAIIIETDNIRKEIFGHQFHQNANNYVFALAESMTTLLLKQNKNVIIDATHMTSASRHKWRRIAIDCDAKVFVAWVYVNKDEDKNLISALQRNLESPIDQQIPVGVMGNMNKYFEDPAEQLRLDTPINDQWFELIEYSNEDKYNSK